MIVIAMKKTFSYVNDHCRTVCALVPILFLFIQFVFLSSTSNQHPTPDTQREIHAWCFVAIFAIYISRTD